MTYYNCSEQGAALPSEAITGLEVLILIDIAGEETVVNLNILSSALV